MSVYFVK